MSDQDLNPTLRKQVVGLRGMIFGNVMKANETLPEYYNVESVDGEPCALITDLRDGKDLKVGLCDLSGALEALRTFG